MVSKKRLNFLGKKPQRTKLLCPLHLCIFHLPDLSTAAFHQQRFKLYSSRLSISRSDLINLLEGPNV